MPVRAWAQMLHPAACTHTSLQESWQAVAPRCRHSQCTHSPQPLPIEASSSNLCLASHPCTPAIHEAVGIQLTNWTTLTDMPTTLMATTVAAQRQPPRARGTGARGRNSKTGMTISGMIKAIPILIEATRRTGCIPKTKEGLGLCQGRGEAITGTLTKWLQVALGPWGQ